MTGSRILRSFAVSAAQDDVLFFLAMPLCRYATVPLCHYATLTMAWRIEKQQNGRYAIFSTRIDDYIVIDAEPLQIAQIYAEKGVKVYLASARAQITKEVPVPAAGEEKIEASRKRGSAPKEGRDVPIGVTGFTVGELESLADGD